MIDLIQTLEIQNAELKKKSEANRSLLKLYK